MQQRREDEAGHSLFWPASFPHQMSQDSTQPSNVMGVPSDPLLPLTYYNPESIGDGGSRFGAAPNMANSWAQASYQQIYPYNFDTDSAVVSPNMDSPAGFNSTLEEGINFAAHHSWDSWNFPAHTSDGTASSNAATPLYDVHNDPGPDPELALFVSNSFAETKPPPARRRKSQPAQESRRGQKRPRRQGSPTAADLHPDSESPSRGPSEPSTPRDISFPSPDCRQDGSRRPRGSSSGSSNTSARSHVCANCTTQTTSLWRRDERGQALCNACGLHQKHHGRPRPQALKTDVIKRRNRKTAPKESGEKE